MTWKEQYGRAKIHLSKDQAVCTANRKLFAKFLEHEEYVLKRIRGNASLDENSHKTLVSAISRLRTVNRWFRNKNWRELKKADIKRVYDDLEDGRITTLSGRPLKDKRTYYRIFRGKPFEMAGKGKLAKQVLQFAPRHAPEEVRFIREADFRRLVDTTSKTEQRAFLWLCWDIGENASSILQLRKSNCVRQINPDSREPEYLVNLPKLILKRSRKARSEPTNYAETVTYLDRHLKSLPEDALLFDFGSGWAKKFFLRSVAKTEIRCLPGGQRPTLKDLRSSMACDLLSKGWSRDEVNARLGHAPSSKEIDRYINYLAIDRSKPKHKMQESRIAALTREVEMMREQLKLTTHRLQKTKESNETRIARLKEVATIQCDIASLALELHVNNTATPEFLRKLTRLHSSLHKAKALLQADESITMDFE